VRTLPEERLRLLLKGAESLRAYIRRRVGNPTDAEEVFQDLSLLVIRHHTGPEDADRFSAWCRALARHVLAHHFRTKRRRANLLSRIELDCTSFELTHDLDPERAASAREALQRLGTELDPSARELLAQRFLHGRSTEDIAHRLEQSPTAVRMRLMRLRSMFKRHSS
jgi:RNA polymerase sigma factor (sigma-70 family)